MKPRDFGNGFRVTPVADGRGLRLEAPFVPSAWQVRRPGGPLRPPFPGSALEIDERWYEIASVAPTGSGVVFVLEPWDDREPIRAAERLDAATCDTLAQEHARRSQDQRRATLLTLVLPMVGMLPADDQRALARAYGISVVRGTILSALLLLVVGFAGWLLALAARQGMDFGAWQPFVRRLMPWSAVFVYLVLESLFRLRGAVSTDEPVGSLPVAGPLLLWRGLRGAATRPRTVPSVKPAPALLQARDRVQPRSHGRLEIVSQLPKDHWTLGITGIAYDEQVYFLIEREVVVTREGPRHRFVLEPVSDDVTPRDHAVYHPEEVRALYREQRRLEAATWVETGSWRFGLLDGELQQRLAEVYDYDPQVNTSWTIVISVALGAFNMVAPWLRENAGFADFLVFLSGLFLLWEAVLRTLALQRGEIRGSLLGRLFIRAAQRALQWAPSSPSADADRFRG